MSQSNIADSASAMNSTASHTSLVSGNFDDKIHRCSLIQINRVVGVARIALVSTIIQVLLIYILLVFFVHQFIQNANKSSSRHTPIKLNVHAVFLFYVILVLNNGAHAFGLCLCAYGHMF